MTTTTNGNVNFIDNAKTAASSMLADMVAMESASSSDSTEILPILGALTGVIGNAIAAGQFGLNVANAATGSNGSLEIEIKNQGSNYLAPYSYKSEHANVSAFPGPIVPGESDSFVITQDGAFTTGSTNVKINMLVSGNTPTSFVPLQISFSYTDGSSPGLWKFEISVDGEGHKFSSEKGIVGVQYVGNSPFPSFNLYVGSIETGGGELLVSVFDPSAS